MSIGIEGSGEEHKTGGLYEKEVKFEDLFDGRLEAFGVVEKIGKQTTHKCRCLTDGRLAYLWIYADDQGNPIFLRRLLDGDPWRIFEAIGSEFGIDECERYPRRLGRDMRLGDDPRYWGFETWSELKAAESRMLQNGTYRDELLKLYAQDATADPHTASGIMIAMRWTIKDVLSVQATITRSDLWYATDEVFYTEFRDKNWLFLDDFLREVREKIIRFGAKIADASEKIDPNTAEVTYWYGNDEDPYGVYDFPDWRSCYGRQRFARSPNSDIWVSFDDLSESTRTALWEMHKDKLSLVLFHHPDDTIKSDHVSE